MTALHFRQFSSTDLKIQQTEAPAWQPSSHRICCPQCQQSAVTVSDEGCREDLAALLNDL